MILLVTIENDEHADLVEQYLQKRGANFFRLDTDALAKGLVITFGFRNKSFFGTIKGLKGQTIDTRNIHVVWYRRVRCNPPQSEIADKNLFDYCFEEYVGFFKNLWETLHHAVWMDKPDRIHFLQEHRLAQYRLATSVGLLVPETFYTNEGKLVAEEMTRRGCVAIKPIAQSFIKIEPDQKTDSLPIKGILTRAIKPGEFSEEQLVISCRNTPVQFQEYVEKSKEIRLTIVGERFFPCEIDSQSSERTKEDWRRYDFSKVKHKACVLPTDMNLKIRSFMKKVGLNFGAIDLIERPNGDYVFLEINPAGQWHWIQILTGMPIAETIGDWLIKNDKVRR